MKKITLFLSVLFMAMVVKAQSDPVTTTYDFEDDNALFVADSRITTAVEEGLGYDGTKAVSFTNAHNAQNGYSFAHYDFSSLVGTPKTITIEYQYYSTSGARAILSIGDADVRGTTGGSSQQAYNNTGAIFALGSIRASSADWSYLNGAKSATSQYCDKWMDVKVTVNVIDKTYSYSIKDASTQETLRSQDNIAYFSSDALECTQIDVFSWTNSAKCAYIDNLSITVEQDTRTYADYTIAFVDESGNAIKDAVTRNGLVGAAIELVNADEESFKNTDNSKKYIYKSDDATDKTIAADGTSKVTVTFREAEMWQYYVDAVDAEEEILKTLAEGSNFESESISVPYNQYIFKDGVLYEAAANNNEYNKKFTLSEDYMTATVSYSVSSKTNVVYFSEAEDIPGLTTTTKSPANVRCSNSAGAYNASETPVEVLTLTPGTYTISAQFVGNKGVDFTITCGAESLVLSTTGSRGDGSKEFTITENTKVTILKAGDSTKCLDWILIQSSEPNSLLAVMDGQNFTAATATYAAATYTRTVNPTYNYGTICLPFAPNAATLENYTFYKLSATATEALTFEEVATPQAGYPYLYKAKDGEATTHVFIGGETTITEDDFYPYSMETEDGSWIMQSMYEEYTAPINNGGWMRMAYYAYKPTAEGVDVLVQATKSLTVKPYRAYFVTTDVPVATMRIVVRGQGDNGDGTTAIEEVITPDQIEGAVPATIYNLMGQPVAQPVKGQIYIVNGQKVVY